MATQLTNRRRAGLTLIETVVAVSLLSSLSALLVPTLSNAREDAKRLTCQSHLGQLAESLLRYRADLDGLPIIVQRDSNETVLGWTTWSYGGWSGRNRDFWSDNNGFGNIQTNERPLSVYMTPWAIPEELDSLTPTQEMPAFQCPSDNRSSQWQWSQNDTFGPSAYDDVGTSYLLNFNWFEQLSGVGIPPGKDGFTYKTEVLGSLVFEKYIVRGSSRFIMLMEDPAAWGVGSRAGIGGAGVQVMGYHGEFSTHMAGFADGHAEYFYMDTRHFHDSPHNPPGPRHGAFSRAGCWTVCEESRAHNSGGRHDGNSGGLPCER